MSDSAFAEIGHNQPPSALELLQEQLATANADLLSRRDELLEASERAPERVEDEETAKKVTTQVSLMNKAAREAETRHTAAKKPHLEAGRAVDQFFNHDIAKPLRSAADVVEQPLTAYQVRKANAEREAREAEARRTADEAARAEREAEEAAAAVQSEEDLDAAIAAEEEASRQAEEAQAAQVATMAKPADLGRTRSDHGLASLRMEWVGQVTDAATVDLEKLRPYLSLEVLNKALRGYVKAGGRELRGASITEQPKTTIR